MLRTVRDDWRSSLPSEKELIFRSGINGIEGLHVGFGVVLNEALQLRKWGQLERAQEQVAVSADLCERVTSPLAGMLSALEAHARHFGTLPSVDPLRPENFRGEAAKQIAWRNETLSRVLWRQHHRFLHKLRSLGEIAQRMTHTYRGAATRVAEVSSLSARLDWEVLDCVHFDLSTALSETKVLLKSFLVALPEAEVHFFHERLATSLCPAREQTAPPTTTNGRVPLFRRQ
jgi:hypothetical protein